MASRSEEILSRSLRKALAELPIDAEIVNSDEFRDNVLVGLEFFLPTVLAELYTEWKGESLDGIYPALARKTGEGEMDIFGQCILISDQALAPIHFSLQIDPTRDEVSWLMLQLGEKLTGETGETGKRGMKRLPYSHAKLDSLLSRIRRLDGNADKLDWRYQVTFGEKRTS